MKRSKKAMETSLLYIFLFLHHVLQPLLNLYSLFSPSFKTITHLKLTFYRVIIDGKISIYRLIKELKPSFPMIKNVDVERLFPDYMPNLDNVSAKVFIYYLFYNIPHYRLFNSQLHHHKFFLIWRNNWWRLIQLFKLTLNGLSLNIIYLDWYDFI